MDNIRSKTALIIEKDGEYLAGIGGIFQRWSLSPYDAWKTRKRDKAFLVAWKVKGNIMLFNPVVGQLKMWRKMK